MQMANSIGRSTMNGNNTVSSGTPNGIKSTRIEDDSDVSEPHHPNGLRQLLKLIMLLFVSYRLFSLAPYNQLPVFSEQHPIDDALDITKLTLGQARKEKPMMSSSKIGQSDTSRLDRERVEQLMREAQQLEQGGNPTHNSKLVSLYTQVLGICPRHTLAHVKLGFIWITSPETSEKGFTMLAKTLDGEFVDDAFPHLSPQAFVLGQTIGRYRWEQKEYKIAQHYLSIAHGAMPSDICTEVMMASMIDPYPESIKAQNDSMTLYLERMNAIIQKSKRLDGLIPLNPQLVKMVPGASDTYVHCLSTLFHHSFYYHTDIAAATRLHYEVAKVVWPQLHYISPKFVGPDGKTFVKPQTKIVNRKIRLGIASGHFTEGSSVVEDFKGVIKHLSRDIFDIFFIYIKEKPVPPSSVMMDSRDKLIVVTKEIDDSEGFNRWMDKPRKDIEALNLDILLYLDLTMSMNAHRLGMSRLAPVQAVSHGHPITSGFPRSIMDYYISWAGAELPFDQAQQHYTEELKLIPSDSLHQYYEERTKSGISLMDNQRYTNFVDMGRSAFPSVPADGNWYLLMQKPFKLMPEFDEFLSGILKRDPAGRLIIHEENSPTNRLIFIDRLRSAGCDMNRVHFMPVLPHHKLMALYILSDVILDSFPAGGCTTTREVLEVGKVLVSLPSTLLGSRWTLGYLRVLGDEILLKNLIADNVEQYIILATDLGRNITKRSEMERRIGANIHKLYRSDRAVKEWTKILLEISPVKPNRYKDEF